MESFTITELSYFLITVSGAISGILMVIWKSRCKKIQCGYGCIECDREVINETNKKGKGKELDIEMENYNDANSI